ncbi:hypothetical protein COBT_003953, partial [Conglomerata obtusa]
MSFTIKEFKNEKKYQSEKMPLICEICQKRGHSKYNCYRKNNFEQKKTYEKFNDNYQKRSNNNYETRDAMIDKRIKYLEKILEKPIDGLLKEFKTSILNPTPEFLKLFEAFPEYYKAKETLKRNEKLLEETIKSIKNTKPKINTLIDKSEQIYYDIIKSDILINDNLIEAVLDTGANFSIISEFLANQLNLPINLHDKSL